MLFILSLFFVSASAFFVTQYERDQKCGCSSLQVLIADRATDVIRFNPDQLNVGFTRKWFDPAAWLNSQPKTDFEGNQIEIVEKTVRFRLSGVKNAGLDDEAYIIARYDNSLNPCLFKSLYGNPVETNTPIIITGLVNVYDNVYAMMNCGDRSSFQMCVGAGDCVSPDDTRLIQQLQGAGLGAKDVPGLPPRCVCQSGQMCVADGVCIDDDRIAHVINKAVPSGVDQWVWGTERTVEVRANTMSQKPVHVYLTRTASIGSTSSSALNRHCIELEDDRALTAGTSVLVSVEKLGTLPSNGMFTKTMTLSVPVDCPTSAYRLALSTEDVQPGRVLFTPVYAEGFQMYQPSCVANGLVGLCHSTCGRGTKVASSACQDCCVQPPPFKAFEQSSYLWGLIQGDDPFLAYEQPHSSTTLTGGSKFALKWHHGSEKADKKCDLSALRFYFEHGDERHELTKVGDVKLEDESVDIILPALSGRANGRIVASVEPVGGDTSGLLFGNDCEFESDDFVLEVAHCSKSSADSIGLCVTKATCDELAASTTGRQRFLDSSQASRDPCRDMPNPEAVCCQFKREGANAGFKGESKVLESAADKRVVALMALAIAILSFVC